MKVLIDGDILVYRTCFVKADGSQKLSLKQALRRFDNMLDNMLLLDLPDIFEWQLYLTGSNNFRIEKAVTAGANHCFMNTGQSCNAPTRMLVSSKQYDAALEVAAAAANAALRPSRMQQHAREEEAQDAGDPVEDEVTGAER